MLKKRLNNSYLKVCSNILKACYLKFAYLINRNIQDEFSAYSLMSSRLWAAHMMTLFLSGISSMFRHQKIRVHHREVTRMLEIDIVSAFSFSIWSTILFTQLSFLIRVVIVLYYAFHNEIVSQVNELTKRWKNMVLRQLLKMMSWMITS